jgi:3-oxoacyl-[acyl-carrier protein] reductase
MVDMNMSLALEVARYRITVSSVASSWIAAGASTPEDMNAAKYVPVGMAGRHEEVADAVTFRTSPESSHITGELLVVDGRNYLIENKASKW